MNIHKRIYEITENFNSYRRYEVEKLMFKLIADIRQEYKERILKSLKQVSDVKYKKPKYICESCEKATIRKIKGLLYKNKVLT